MPTLSVSADSGTVSVNRISFISLAPGRKVRKSEVVKRQDREEELNTNGRGEMKRTGQSKTLFFAYFPESIVKLSAEFQAASDQKFEPVPLFLPRCFAQRPTQKLVLMVQE